MISKIFYIIILLGLAGYGGYYLYGELQKETLTVTGNIQVSQQINIDAQQSSGTVYIAVVKGTIKNNTSKPLKNIFVIYKIADENTSATVFDLQPGEQVEFNTRGVKTGLSHPEFYYDGVQYDENKL
jgi:hypothetical protein